MSSIPANLRKRIQERDSDTCQCCFAPGAQLHHIVLAGMGRQRVHEDYNLVTLCYTCHDAAHQSDMMRRWCEDWSRKRYGSKVDELKSRKWSGEK